MRPHHRSDDLSRVRMLLATELGWLDGYPTGPVEGGLGWQTVPLGAPPATLRVDGEQIHRSNRALRQLLRDHLATLERILGEPPERWRARTQRLLELLSGPAQHGAEVPDPWADGLWEPRLRAMAQATPEALSPLVAALGWRWVGRPNVARAQLSVLQASPEPWSRLLTQPGGLARAMLLLAWIAEDRADRVLPILPLVLQPDDRIRAWRCHDKFTAALLDHLDNQSERALYPQLPALRWSSLLDALITEMASCTRAERRRGLALLALLRPPLAENQLWWTRFAELEAAIAELPEHRRTRRDKRAPADGWHDSLRARVLALSSDRPRSWHPELALRAVRVAARSRGTGPLLLDALPQLAALGDTDAAAAFLVGWTGGEERPRLTRHLARWARSLRAAVRADRLRPWSQPWSEELALWSREVPARRSVPYEGCLTEPDDTLNEGPEAAIERFYGWLDAATTPSNPKDARFMARVFAFTDQVPQAERVMLARGTVWMSDEELAALVRVAAWWPPERMRQLSALRDAELLALADALDWLGPRVDTARLCRMAAAELVEMGQAIAVLRGRGETPALQEYPVTSVDLPGAPAEVHAALADLARWRPDAAAWAAKALGELCPPDAALDSEIAALQARIQPGDGDTPMRRRLESLRARRAAPQSPTGSHWRKLGERARCAADRAFVALQRDALGARVSAALLHALGVAEAPDWLARPEHWRVIAGLGDTTRGIRALAMRLLRQRAGPPPWDLRDEPANRAFVDRLTAQGVNVAPWLGERSLVTKLPNGAPITLSFEADPLEILQMGAHFRTCLSPGEVNFFSAVVNAAEINKRVVYARAADRRVVGRALVALTDAGDLLTFEPYCHQSELDFPAQLRAFTEALAAEMGTSVLPEGAPRMLMAGRWYDDGARDLSDRSGVLSPDSPLVQSLDTIDPEALLPTLRAALKPAPLDGAALRRLIALPVLQARAALLAQLVPELLASRAVSPVDRVCAAAALFRGGERSKALSLLPTLRAGRLSELCCGYQGWIPELAELDPWFILKILRLRGPHHYSHLDAWGQGRALEAIGRPVQALARYREAVALGPHNGGEWVADAAARIASLERRARP